MNPSKREPVRVRVPDPPALIAAVCHEVGNQLAAVRLSVEVAAHEPGTVDLVDGLAARAGALLRQVRPLLFPPVRSRLAVRELFDALERGIARGEGRAPLDVRCARGTPDLRADPSTLHQVLQTLVLESLAASPASSPVRLRGGRSGDRVTLRIEDSGAALEPEVVDPGLPQRGRRLSLQLATALVRRDRGSLRAESGVGGTRVELRLPKA